VFKEFAFLGIGGGERRSPSINSQNFDKDDFTSIDISTINCERKIIVEQRAANQFQTIQ
jgi:hypothetical protein